MPIYESICSDPACSQVVEWYAHRRDQPDPACKTCGNGTKRLISNFGAIWTKGLSDYGDKNRETYHKDQKRGGQWVARKNSGGGTKEQPKYQFLETVQQQRDYCKEEGLFNPSDMPTTMTVDKSGEKLSSSGNRGQWV